MLDAYARKLIDPPLDRVGGLLARAGVGANAVTLVGAGGLACWLHSASCSGQFTLALWLVLASRVADGLDGAIARASTRTDFGGYLDITADFAFYGAIPMAFILYDPATNGIAGAVLLLSFYVNGASFLGYAILAAKKGARYPRTGHQVALLFQWHP